MLINYIEDSGRRRFWSSLDAWTYAQVYGQKYGYGEDAEGYVWSNDINLLLMLF